MGRKIKLEVEKNKEINDPRSSLISSISREENPIGIKAFNLIHFLTREHLKKMKEEYDLVKIKHAGVLILPEVIKFFRDKEEIMSRFEKLKQCYLALSKFRYEESKKKDYGKKGKGSSSTLKKNIDTDPEMNDFVKNDMIENVKKLHKFNMDVFGGCNTYTTVGFNEFRYNQCPNTHASSSLFESGEVPNRALHEGMLFIKIIKEDMISDDIEEEEIRILSFGLKQDMNSLKFYITIPEILQHKDSKISLKCSETGIYFYVEGHNEKNYIFEIENFANKINAKAANYMIIKNDTVLILVEKKKKGMWKYLFFYKKQTRVLWEAEMKEVLRSSNSDPEEHTGPFDFVWKIALILVNCRTDFLRLPKDLNHVRLHFSNIDEMIYYYKTMIPLNPDLKALFFFYGGALLFKLMKSASLSKLETTTNKKAFSKFKKDMLDKINKEIEVNRKNFEKGYSLQFEGEFEEAYLCFLRASRFCSFPRTILMKGTCLLEMGREKEAFMDSIFALRNLGPNQGFPALLNILEYKIRSGNVIHAIDMAISVEFYHISLNDYQRKALKDIRERGLYYLDNIFKGHSLIFKKKYKDSIPFLEEAESIVSIKSGLTSIILLLLYFISKNYENVFILGNKIFKKQEKYIELSIFLYAMSKFYTKQLRSATKNFERIESSCWREYTRVKLLDGLIFIADDFMKKGKMPKFLAWYYRNALLLAEDNEQMLAHIWSKLGVLNYWHNNLIAAVNCLDRSVQLSGENICTKIFLCILVIRSVACDKLGMVNEAKEDRKAVRKIYFEVYKKTAEGIHLNKEISLIQTYFDW